MTNENGQPLAGATVEMKGTGKGAITGANEDFLLNGVGEKEVIMVSFIGYKSIEVTIGNVKQLELELQPETDNLDKVVVQAYRTTTQQLATGNIGKVRAEDIKKQPVSNRLAALEERVPSLYITETSGVQGGSFTVQIRGLNSIENGNNPFYIIDGVGYIFWRQHIYLQGHVSALYRFNTCAFDMTKCLVKLR